MFENVELSDEEKMKVAKVAGSFIGKLCFGAAIGLKGVGFAIDKSTGLTVAGLRIAADGVETVGKVASGFCYEKSDALKDKAEEYDLSDISDSKPEEKKDMAEEIVEEGDYCIA